jgi:hypothetical protein
MLYISPPFNSCHPLLGLGTETAPEVDGIFDIEGSTDTENMPDPEGTLEVEGLVVLREMLGFVPVEIELLLGFVVEAEVLLVVDPRLLEPLPGILYISPSLSFCPPLLFGCEVDPELVGLDGPEAPIDTENMPDPEGALDPDGFVVPEADELLGFVF